MSKYIETYREWTTIRMWIKRWKHDVTPEKFQSMKKKERELMSKLNEMIK